MVASKRTFWPVEQVGFLDNLPLDIFLHTVENVDFHIHAAFEIILVISGSMRLYTEPGEERVLSAGDVAIVHGWQPHATQALGDRNMVLVLQFDPAATRHDPKFASRRFELDASGPAGAALRGLLSRMLVETRMKRAGWQMSLEALLLDVRCHLLRFVPHRIDTGATEIATAFEERKLSAHMQNAAAFIRRNSMKAINLDDVAAANGLSAGYLARLFRNETGGSFTSFLTQVRLLRALELLSGPRTVKMASVALDCGFPNIKSFNLAFRRTFNCVPSEWRKMYQVAQPSAYGRTDAPATMATLLEWAKPAMPRL